MVGWQRSLQSIIRHVGKRVEQNLSASTNLSSGAHINSTAIGQSCYLPRSLNFSTRIVPPFHQYLQHLGISTTRNLLAESSSNTKPISSPLSPPVLAITSGKDEEKVVVPKRSEVQAILKNIKQSPKKVNLVAALVRGMRVEDALVQLNVTVKRAAKTVHQVILSARANATHNHGLDQDRLLVAEAFVGKGFYKKRVSYHSKGRSGVKMRPECRLTVVVREMTPEEEADVARIRVSRYKYHTRRERRLVPHKLIETTPIWGRKNRMANGSVAA